MAEPTDESLKTLMEVTGVDVEVAKKVLKYRENNLDHAINWLLDGNDPNSGVLEAIDLNQPSTSAFENLAGPNMPILEEDNVRAPIPPKRETLILPEEDNFRFRKRRNAHQICPLRNFEREGELLEEELFSDQKYRGSRKKRVLLEDIFRPPVDICYCGSFQTARDYATELNRWLIVNVQDHTIFLSQCLNRDVWSNLNLKNVIKNSFIFWQVSADNTEGARFKTFYNVVDCPYVCIIDPRTGEQKINIKNFAMKPDQFIKEFYVFLRENGPYPYSQEVEKVNGTYDIVFKDISGKRMQFDETVIINSSSESSMASTSKLTPETSVKSNLENVPFEKLTEEEQIELAIKQSLNEAKIDNGGADSVDEEVESMSEDDEPLAKSTKYENYLGSNTDPKTKLQIRLPNDEREIVEWPSSSTIRAIKLYLKTKYPELTKGQYKILNTSTFPKRNILDLADDTRFDKCDLHPASTLYLHPDD